MGRVREVSLKEWLAAIDRSPQWLADQLCKPRRTIASWCRRDRTPAADDGHRIVEFSRRHPGPNGEVVGYLELAREERPAGEAA